MDRKTVHPLNAVSLISNRLTEYSTVCIATQFSKAPLPIIVTLSGSFIVWIATQPLNVSSPMVSMVSAIVTSANLLHPKNSPLPVNVVPWGITTFSRLVHSLNA